jgi:hypothetical protein
VLLSASMISAEWLNFTGSHITCNAVIKKCTAQYDQDYYYEWDATEMKY